MAHLEAASPGAISRRGRASLAGAAIGSAAPGTATKSQVAKKQLVVIDAGPGGQDPAWHSRSLRDEKDAAQGLALAIKAHLLQGGRTRGILTRKCDLVPSVHADTNALPIVHGAAKYSLSPAEAAKGVGRLDACRDQRDDINCTDIGPALDQARTVWLDFCKPISPDAAIGFARSLQDSTGRTEPNTRMLPGGWLCCTQGTAHGFNTRWGEVSFKTDG